VRIIEPLVEVDYFDADQVMRTIERKGRVAYKSEDHITSASAYKFVRSLIERGHESVIEHVSLGVKITTDRGVTHEIVRHRLGSYTQESTRYCNYAKNGEGEVTFIRPFFFLEGSVEYNEWLRACMTAEDVYVKLIRLGVSPQQARSVLPNSLKTEIEITYNLREWRHFFKLRCHKTAHPQMQQIAIPLLQFFKMMLPEVFIDIGYNREFPVKEMAQVKLVQK
jgi:thymidylate synthase (FAD)